MSGGRVELGLGAGLVRRGARGVRHPVPAAGERFDRLEEQLADHHRPVGDARRRDLLASTGEHYTVDRLARRCRSRCSGRARRSSSAAGARGARPRSRRGSPTSSTCRSRSVESRGAQFDRVRAACEAAGRDPASSARPPPVVPARPRRGRDRPARRGDRPRGRRAAGQRRSPARPAEIVERIGEFADAGAEPHLPPGAGPRRPRPPAPGGRGDPAAPLNHERTMRHPHPIRVRMPCHFGRGTG